MILRPFTLICLAAAAGSGLYLYQTKHHAQMLERDIARTMKATDVVRQRGGLMRAEYALLNDPSRLAELSEQLLPALKTTAPSQFAALADLERRLPAVGAPPPPPPLEPEAPDAVLPKPAAKTEPAKVEPSKMEPAKVEAPKPEPARPPLIASRPRPAMALASATPVPAQSGIAPATSTTPTSGAPVSTAPVSGASPVIAAVPLPPRAVAPASMGAPLPLHAATRPAAMPVVAAAPLARPAVMAPVHAPGTPADAIARIARGAPVDPSLPAVASALGMARTMVPSTSPISSAQAAFMSNGQR